ncbi:hypothetical protein Ciccas_011411 [Cichlidogyrus casuarinus]|uniref:Uncharacterized protein n=1 Tax=Cichlidogyrus casuarinus TaxID=1844966 RepID=A0ABD2PTD6_9PLAT
MDKCDRLENELTQSNKTLLEINERLDFLYFKCQRYKKQLKGLNALALEMVDIEQNENFDVDKITTILGQVKQQQNKILSE